ncbi:MAG TPA: hypothetical protein VFT55_07400, partial [Planctomycetota bacterium]|nr:hypothetical protein [Planctomycetota bacterium]
MTRQHTLRLVAVALACTPLATAQLLPDFDPAAPFTVWNTDSTQVQPFVGPPYTVTGGVFVFRNFRIGAGKTLRITGSRPMLLLCNSIEVHGTI